MWSPRWLPPAVLLGAFWAIEARGKDLLLPLRVLRSRDRSGSCLIMLYIGTGLLGMLFFLNLFLQDVWGYSAPRTGLAFLPFLLEFIATSALAQRAVAKTPPPIAGGQQRGRRRVDELATRVADSLDRAGVPVRPRRHRADRLLPTYAPPAPKQGPVHRGPQWVPRDTCDPPPPGLLELLPARVGAIGDSCAIHDDVRAGRRQGIGGLS